MVARPNVPYITPQQYLERERKAEFKSEYFNGEIVAMSGASRQHNRATVNILAGLHTQLTDKTCEPFPSDMRVQVPAHNRYFYPDVSVVCGEAIFEDSELDTLLNPTLIVEVLSASTAKIDQGEKWLCYQTLESLQTYVLVAQDSPQIQVYERRSDDTWTYFLVARMDATLPLPSIGCQLPLAAIYARVEFPTTERVSDTNSPDETP